MIKKYLIAGIAAVTALAAAAQATYATVIVSPNAQTASDGDTQNRFPFFVSGGMRYQQVYAASDFSALGGPDTITRIAFRCNQTTLCSSFSQLLTSIEIRLSTTAAAPDALSTTFSANIGADEILVYSGALTLSSAGQTGTPNPFDVVIALQTGFLYDPGAGNLLLDVTNNSSPGDIGIFLDAQGFRGVPNGDAVSRLFTDEGGQADATGSADSLGLVTQFTTASQRIPEPGTLVLFGLGLAGLGFAGRRKAAA